MKLVSFTVVKYRSILKAHKIKLDKKTILVGPNNEGKSNLLRALVVAMRVLTRVRHDISRPPTLAFRFGSRNIYEWERDFPIQLQIKFPDGKSEITLEFDLTSDEIQEFRRNIKSDLNGTLPIKITFNPTGQTKIEVVKKGPGGKALTNKSGIIAAFISKRMNFEHIPAVRTASAAEEIVSEMVGRELEILDNDPAYKEALKSIAKLQQPILDQVSKSIRKTLLQFLPEIKEVKVKISSEERYRALRRSCQIMVNDGTATLLQHKGDGVQSLAALGIMRHASESGSLGRNLVIAIEEPESHLHPKAIHELKDVINDLCQRYQVVITTHNPLFVDKGHINNNVIVKGSRAYPAKDIDALRKVLGVRTADNLRHAELILLVEGEDDKKSVSALLSHHSNKCKEALDNGVIAIDSLNGGTNLPYKASLVRDALCLVHCFMDDDRAARDGFEKARTEGIIKDSDINWTTCVGMAEAEIEDLYDPEIYNNMLMNDYRVSILAPEFSSSKKWSERMTATFKRQGKRWDERVEKAVKEKISDIVSINPSRALLEARKSVFIGLVKSLEQRLGELEKSR